MSDSISSPDTKAEWLATYNELAHSLSQRTDSSRAGKLLARKSLVQDMMVLRGLHILASVRCNEFALINALPVELLSMIFEHLAWAYPHRSSSLHGSGWISANRVCRKWYRVMADTAKLWSTISFDGREPLGLFIPRSKRHPLYIAGNISYLFGDRIQRMLQLFKPEHFSRVREFRLETENSHISGLQDVFPRFFSAEQTHAPQLEVLELESPLQERRLGLGHTFVSSRAPRLRKVVLKDYFFPWGAGSSSLRHLYLTFSYTDPDGPVPYTLDDVLLSLAAMPNLETLDMKHSLPVLDMNPHQFIQTHSTVLMPHLKALSLYGRHDSYWVLSALLKTHPLAHIDISVAKPCPDEIMITALSPHAGRSDRPPYTHLILHQSTEGITVCFSVSGDMQDSGVEVYFSLEVADPNHTISRMLSYIPLSLEGVTNLSVWGPFLNMHLDTPIFAIASSLTFLELGETGAVRAFCTLLLPLDVLYGEARSRVDVPVPNLADVRIITADLTATHDAFMYPSEPIGQCLGRALAIRKDAGHALAQLYIYQCAVKKMWVRFLCEVTTIVYWDGGQKLKGEDSKGDAAGGVDPMME